MGDRDAMRFSLDQYDAVLEACLHMPHPVQDISVYWPDDKDGFVLVCYNPALFNEADFTDWVAYFSEQ